ncbi:MAG: molybdate ABC transporter substrate-binding protein [Gammaproteobacteria bacterium]|nr:molybdate ABC transporter substrate-binding protein [Gammaproteobacteria bacterium]
MSRAFVAGVLLFCLSGSLNAAEIRIAVASNFKPTLQLLAPDFKEKTGHELIVSSASTGKLYAQITHGAPYDIFMSADEKYADLLIANNIAGKDGAYIYALGKLLFVSNIADDNGCKQVLMSPELRRLAIANYKIAPYGLAAKQVLDNLGLWQGLRSKVVMGENIAQTFQFVFTKNADAGFVAQSLLEMASFDEVYACLWRVPTDLYSPIKQKMVVLNKAKNKNAVEAFVRYIKSSDARDITETTGYGTLDN